MALFALTNSYDSVKLDFVFNSTVYYYTAHVIEVGFSLGLKATNLIKRDIMQEKIVCCMFEAWN